MGKNPNDCHTPKLLGRLRRPFFVIVHPKIFFSNDPSYVSKMVTMPIYGKNPSKSPKPVADEPRTW